MNKMSICRRFVLSNKNILYFNNFKTFAETQKRIQIDTKKKEFTQEETEALESHRESFNKITEFMVKRESYTWQDYLQQIIVRVL